MKLKPLAAALISAGLLSTSVIAAGSAGAWSLSDLVQRPKAVVAEVAAAPAAAPAPIAPVAAPDFRKIVQTYGPAVVGITVEGTRRVAAGSDDGDDPFSQFFRGLPGQRGVPRGGVPFRGQGSGFIVDRDGLILTNAHVVQGAKEVTVRLSDRRELRAKVLGADKATDIAVLRIDAKNLPAVALGDPAQLQVGDYVLAIGAPYGLEQTATQGIVSAKGRSLPGDSFVPFIQTDAAVNPGNSGGPLFDAAGRVVGINAQIFSQSGGFQGLAFAIPIDVALKVKDQIVRTGKVEHARLGVTVQDLNQSLAEAFALETPDGALVSSVQPGTAAARAGLKPGDVILRVDGTPVHTAGDVSSRVGLSEPGRTMKLTVWRDRARRELDVKLGTAGADREQQAAVEAAPGTLGLALRPLSPDERRQSGLDHGLLVEDSDGAAARAGIHEGDIVLALNGKPVTSAEQIRRALEGKPRHVALLIQRADRQIFVPINLG
jgi:serine protease Do